MRIALFTETFLPKIDGIVTRLMHTLDQLAAQGHEAIVFAPGHPPARYAGQRVVPVNSVAFKPWYPEVRMGLPTARIASTMLSFQPDVVHAVNPIWTAAYGVLSAKRRDLPLLASFHTDVPQYTQRLGLEWITATTSRFITWIHNQAQVNLCTSDPMVKQAQAARITNVDLWPKGVDTQTYHPQHNTRRLRDLLSGGHPDDPLLVYVGRLSKEKDLEVLRGVIAQVPGARLALVGSGPQKDELKRIFAGTPTVFTGYLSGQALAEAYAAADVFVFPSTTETLGLVALEAMASGVPVVAARAGGIPFAVHDGVDGFLFRPGDAAQAAAQVRRLLDNPALYRRMSLAARAGTEALSWQAATNRLVEFYQLAIDRHRAAAVKV